MNLIFKDVSFVLLIGFGVLSLATNAYSFQQNEDLTKLKKEFESTKDLDPESSKRISALLEEVSKLRAQAKDFGAKDVALTRLPKAAQLKTELTAQLADAKKPIEKDLTNLSNGEIESLIASTKEKIESIQKLAKDAEMESTRRTARREEIRSRIIALERLAVETESKSKALPESDDSLLGRLVRLNLEALQQEITSELSYIKSELNRYDEEDSNNITSLRQELFSAQLASNKSFLTKIEKKHSEDLERMADAKTKEAKKELEAIKEENPILSKCYEQNAKLAEKNLVNVTRGSEVKSELTSVRSKLAILQQQYSDIVAITSRIGLSGSIGAVLRKRKSELPNPQSNVVKANETKVEVDQTQFEIFDIDRQTAELSQESIRQEIKTFNPNVTPGQLDALAEQIDVLIESRKEILVDSKKTLNLLFESLVDMEFRYRAIADVSREYRNYVNERILWIQSNKFLFTELEIDDSDKSLFKQKTWQSAFAKCSKLIWSNPFSSLILLIIAIGLFVVKKRLRGQITEMGQIARRGSCATFWPTGRALFATLVIAMTYSWIPLILGVAISESNLNDGKSLFSALGSALLATAWFAIPVEIFRHVCRAKGLAELHLSWPNASVALLKKNLGWFTPVTTLIVFLTSLVLRLDLRHHIDLIERLLFLLGLTSLFVMLFRCLHPQKGIFSNYLAKNEQSWARQTSVLWFGAILLIPVSLGALTVFGYYYTALNLMRCTFTTFVFAMFIETSRALLHRFILVRRRHVHIEAAKRKRLADREVRRKQALEHQDDAYTETLTTPEITQPSLENLAELDDEMDIDENASKAKNLVAMVMWLVWGIGLWVVWSDVLPALKALDNQPIFPSATVEKVTSPSKSTIVAPPKNEKTEKENADEGSPMPLPEVSNNSVSSKTGQNVKELSQVTYGDALLFLIISLVTFAAARHLPSALEMVFLNQLPVDRSIRYATKSLISYCIVLVGMMLAFRALSISWTNVQWLATALTFGLAFGLQEIFANFVAGIILMFERPLRIGDWITIDEFTGMVTKIRTRATTIVNLDRKEFVIPNKDFITGRLVNWTLSDALNRIEVKVGIAYGSNVEKAKQLLLEICENHAKIVNEPPPQVLFQNFGDSSLDLYIRAFLRDIDSRMPMIDELHVLINKSFKENGIEISFPQRDLHVRSIDQKLLGTFGSQASKEK